MPENELTKHIYEYVLNSDKKFGYKQLIDKAWLAAT